VSHALKGAPLKKALALIATVRLF